ncbi:MAG: methyl-accepting chemotaxis protein [Spirochaetales bacterium]
MDPSGSDPARQAVLEILEGLAASVSQGYSRLEHTMGALAHELETGGLAHGFPGQPEGDALAAKLASLVGLIQHHTETMAASHTEGEILLSNLGEQVEALAQLGSSIDAIREDSILMELISLNAMVIAVKAGESGRAFSTITTELKGLSNDTMALTDQIAGGETRLGTAFASYREELQSLGQRTQADLQAFRVSVSQALESLRGSGARLVEGLRLVGQRANLTESSRTKGTMPSLSLASIRQLLERLQPSVATLEEVALALAEVSSQVEHDRDRCRAALSQIQEQVDTLEEQRQALLSTHLGSGPEGLDRWFSVCDDLFAHFVASVADSNRQREASFRKRVPLQKSVAGLVELLRAFDGLLAKFRNVDLASRVQVARHKALGPMRDNATEMSALTRKIETDVGQSSRVTLTFFQKAQQLLQAYGEQFATQLRLSQGFVHHLKADFLEVRDAKALLVRTVQESGFVTYTLTELLHRAESELENLDTLLVQLESQASEVDKKKEHLGNVSKNAP